MGVSIQALQINPRIIEAAERGFQDGSAVLSLSGTELERLTGLNSNDVIQLKNAVSEAVLGGLHSITALELWKRECSEDRVSPKLSTGCQHLDKVLRGGLLVKGITEIVGESAAGKTQLCLQLCLTVQLPFRQGGLNAGAIYISTEGAFPHKRLNQMARYFSKQHASVTKHCFMDHILLEHIADFDGLQLCVQKKLPVALASGKVKLVVVDSVAALFRCHYDNHNMVGRSKHLSLLGTELRWLADCYNAAIVCVNQVSANMSRVNENDSQPRQNVPALGLIWADHVMCRLMMSRLRDPLLSVLPVENVDNTDLVNKTVSSRIMVTRQFEVVFAPHLEPARISLVITQAGIACEISWDSS